MKSLSDADRLIGHRIALLRRQRGLSQRTLGDALGVSFQQVQKYEKGVNRIAAGKLADVAQLFDISQADLLGSDVEAHPHLLQISREAFSIALAFDRIPKGPDKSALRAAIAMLLKAAEASPACESKADI